MIECLIIGDSIAVDTETLGHNPHRDRLCLVQLSAGDGSAHIIQIPKEKKHAPNLKDLLTNPKVLKIFHYARFDIAAIEKSMGIETKHIYCTVLLTGFLVVFSILLISNTRVSLLASTNT